jgi:glycosyltransferase involved in cell wall biosynthesis
MDDYSQDDSRAIIEEYRGNEKISHIVFNSENSGSTFKQWKKGIELAQAEWIWIAESDDYCDERLLESIFLNVYRCDNTVISYCQSYYREEGSISIQDMSFHTNSLDEHHWRNDYCNKGADEIRKFLLYKNTIPNASAVLFSKNAYIHADKSFEKMRLCGDWMLWMELLKLGNIAFCSKPLNNFRAHSATTRVLDTYSKMQSRLEEEYIIAVSIKQYFKYSVISDIEKRLKSLVADYSYLFKRKEVLRFVLNPNLYKSRVPYTDFMVSVLKRMLIK